MNCRYCGNVYADEDRTCGGCGAPKHALRQKVLDAPATPDHWSNSLKDTIYRVLIVTVAMVALVAGAAAAGLGGFAGVVAFFWAMPVAPTLMTYAAWRDARGDWAGWFLRGLLVLPVWCAVFFVVLMSIGFAASV